MPRIDEIRWSRIRDLHLEELYLADNIKVIHSGAFQDCTVKKLRLPHRGLQEIRRNADGHNSSMRGTRYTGPKLQQISGSHYSIKQLFDSGSYIQNNGSELLKNNIYIKNNDTYTIKYLNNKWHIAPLSSVDNRLRKISFKFLVDDIHYLIHTNDRNVPPDYYYPNNKAPNFELRPTGRHKWANRIIYDRSKNMIVKFKRNSFGRSVRDWEYKLSNVYQYYFIMALLTSREKTRDERLVDVLENLESWWVTTINVVSSNRGGRNINTMNPN